MATTEQQERIYELAKEMKGGNSRIKLDDIKRAANKLRKHKNPHSDDLWKNLSDKERLAARTASLDTVIPKPPTKVNPVDRAKGGLIKKKKSKKSSRLAKRGYGIAKRG